MHGYACAAGGKLFKTIDGGLSWSQEPTLTTVDFYTIEVHQGSMYAVGGNGTIAAYGYPNGLTPITQPAASLEVIPNPVNNQLLIRNSSGMNEIRICDWIGNILLYEDAGSQQSYQLDVSALSPGFYLLQVSGHDTNWIQKIQKL